MTRSTALGLAMLLSVGVVAQQPDVTKLGPQVGQTAPDFSVQDQAGQIQTLKSIVGPNGAMLVFYRSADW